MHVTRGVDPALALQAVPGWGPRTIDRLVEVLGPPESVLATSPGSIGAVIGASGEVVRQALASIPWKALRQESRRLRRMDVGIATRFDGTMPVGWLGMSDPPVAVRVQGRIEALRRNPGVAIVGARRCSALGADLAARFAVAFVEAGWTVVSGGARGIDASAHRAALRVGGTTIAVVGSGLARPYPPEHVELYREIAIEGAVVSEYPLDREVRPSNFPVRNRLVAGFGPGTIVVEAGARSGALITARLAAEDYGREVVAIPGRPDLGGHAGCHRAIREGWATLVEDPEQALDRLSSQWGLLWESTPRDDGDGVLDR